MMLKKHTVRSKRALIKKDPTMAVVLRRLDEEGYVSNFIGGRNCARLTVPILTTDQIRKAGLALEELGRSMQDVAEGKGTALGKVLEARFLIGQVHQHLKGGVSYKGAR